MPHIAQVAYDAFHLNQSGAIPADFESLPDEAQVPWVAAAFAVAGELENTDNTGLSFGEATARMVAGIKIRRAAWPSGVFLIFQRDSEEGGTDHHLRLKYEQDGEKRQRLWQPTHTDLLARDWESHGNDCIDDLLEKAFPGGSPLPK